MNNQLNPLLTGLAFGSNLATDWLNAHAEHQMLQNKATLSALMSQHPELSAPGTAGQIGWMKYYGKDTPEGNLLQQSLQSDVTNQQTLSDWRRKMAETAGARNTTALAKNQAFLQLQALGYTPNEINTLSDEQRSQIVQNNMVNPNANLSEDAQKQAIETASAISKQTMTGPQLNQNLRLQSFLKQWNSTLPYLESASKYAGMTGHMKLQAEKLAQGLRLSEGSEDYSNMINFSQGMKTLAQEALVALGGHATNEQIKDINTLANPSLAQTPKQFKNAYYRLKNIIDEQQKSISKPLAEQVNYGQSSTANNESQNQELVTVYSPTGKKVTIPASMLPKLLNSGGRLHE